MNTAASFTLKVDVGSHPVFIEHGSDSLSLVSHVDGEVSHCDRGVTLSSLVIMRVLSRMILEIVEVGEGLWEGIWALSKTTVAQVC